MDQELGSLFERIYARPSVAAIQELSASNIVNFVAFLFNKEGKYSAIVTSGVGDGGIDIELRTGNVAHYTLAGGVTCMRFQRQDIGPRLMRAFLSALKKANLGQGYVITAFRFTPSARAECRDKQVHLLDVDDIIRWIEEIKLASLSSLDSSHQPHAVYRAPIPAPSILCIANNKGGVGKTTVAGNLAAALAANQQTVLLIDCDPQGNLSSWLSPNLPVRTSRSLSSIILEGYPIHTGMHPTTEQGVWLVPSDSMLERIPWNLNLFALESRLRQSLTQHADYAPQIDYVIIDTPPALNALTRSALIASNSVLVPFRLDNFSYDGVKRLLDFIEDTEVRHDLKPLRLLGGVATFKNTTYTLLGKDFETQIPVESVRHPRMQLAHLTADTFWRGIIHQREEFLRAVNQRKTVISLEPHSKAATEMHALAREIWNYAGRVDAPHQ